MVEATNPMEESLLGKLESCDSEILSVNAGKGKPIFSVTVKGTAVAPKVFEACEKFSDANVMSVRQSTFTQEIGESMTVVFKFN